MENSAPGDPMWETFRERHPDVNLVLLPGDGAPDPPPPAPPPTIDDALAAAAALERRVRLVGEMLAVPHDPVLGWDRLPGGAYQPTARLNGSASADGPVDAEIIQHRLNQLGWNARVRPEPELVWVDGEAGEDFVRVTIVDGIVGIRATGARMSLDEDAVEHIMRGNG